MKIMTAAEAKEALEKKRVLLVDVRQPSEHRSAHIEGAHLMPLDTLQSDKLARHDQAILLYCHAGKRSQQACQKLLADNPSLEVYSLDGGILAWQKAGFHVHNIKGAGLPLERQTLLAAGLVVLTGVILGTWLHPGLYGLCALAGAGLTLAGLTGWCGMAKLLALMPWNR